MNPQLFKHTFASNSVLQPMAAPQEPEFDPTRHHCHDRELLKQELLKFSAAKVWEDAKLEWICDDVYWQEHFTHCLCGHGIKERCILLNETTDAKVIVGNCCVKQFMAHLLTDMPTDAMMASIKRVKRSPDKALHKKVVNIARRQEVITAWAEQWYLKTARKRELTEKEYGYRRRLNRKILSRKTNSNNAAGLFDEAADLSEAARESHVPFDGPWCLGDDVLAAARAQGKVTEWEEEFYRGNFEKQFVSDRQAPIKRRIEECAWPEPWQLDEAALEQEQRSGRITAWEARFYKSNLGKPRFTQKQAAIKWRIEERVA
jgi:hypothetical protein